MSLRCIALVAVLAACRPTGGPMSDPVLVIEGLDLVAVGALRDAMALGDYSDLGVDAPTVEDVTDALLQAREGPPPSKLVVLLGDSNAAGVGVPSAADTAFSIATAYPLVQLHTLYAPNPGNALVDIPITDLQPQTLGAGTVMGPELSMGRALYQSFPGVTLGKIGISGTHLGYWNGLYLTDVLTAIHAFEDETGKALGCIVLSAGANDASVDETLANAYAGELASLIASIRAEFGASIKVVLMEVPSATVVTHIAIVRAASLAYVSGDPLSRLVETDDLPLIDTAHFTADSYVESGTRAAAKVLDVLGIDPYVPATVPEVVRIGMSASGDGAITVHSDALAIDGDLEILIVAEGYDVTAPSLSDAQGFTAVTGGAQVSVYAGSFYCSLKLFERSVTQAALDGNGGIMPTPTIANTGTLQGAKIITIRKADGTPAAIASVNGGVNNDNGTALTIPSFTTVGANNLVLYIVAGVAGTPYFDFDPTAANGALTGIVNRPGSALLVSANTVMIGVSTGTKVAAGAVGSATITSDHAGILAGISIAVAP